GDDNRLAAFHDGDYRVRGAQIDADDFAHVLIMKSECDLVKFIRRLSVLYSSLPASPACNPQGCMRFHTLSLAAGFALAIVSLGSIGASAQTPAPPPAHISAVSGDVTIDHDGQSDPAEVNIPIMPGDRVRTGNGRVTVVLSDGSSIAIDSYSDV